MVGNLVTRRAQGKRRPISRRTFFVGAALAASMLLWKPRVAFADEPWWDNSLIFRGYGKKYGNQFWDTIGSVEAGDGGAQSGTMYTDRWVSAKTPWVEWDLSSNQFVRTASKITVRCDFTTELYYHITGRLEIACGSYNGRNASYNLWHTDSGDDTRFSLYHAIDDRPIGGSLEESKVVVIDNEAGSGIHKDGAHVWTDYRWYPQSNYSVWVRRLPQAAKHSFQLRSWFWNYYYFGTNWYYDRSNDPPIGYGTKWVEQYADAIYITCNASWGNRVVVLESCAQPGKCLESAVSPSAGARCTVVPRVRATKQHWIVQENEPDDIAGTYRFIPVPSLDGAHQLDQSGGGPTMEPSPAQLWYAQTAQLNRAQAFWVHGSAQAAWLFADCSGMALDCGGDAGSARFHSNGYPAGEWGNADHIWTIQDARFSTADDQPFSLQGDIQNDCVAAGETISAPDSDGVFVPGCSGRNAVGLRCDYTWVVSDDAFPEKGFPEIMGIAKLHHTGWLDEQPAVNLVGSMQKDDGIVALSLRIEEGSLPGSVQVQLCASGTWRDGAKEGAAADALRITLQGEAATWYTLHYRVCCAHAVWGAWVEDSQMASGPPGAISGVQVRFEPKGIVQQGSETSLFIDDAWRGKFLTCIVRAATEHASVLYRGAALSRTLQIGNPVVAIRFVVDGETTPCFEDQVEEGMAYYAPTAATSAGKKPGCSGFDGWYTDSACSVPFAEGSQMQGKSVTLYGRNVATVRYGLTARTQQLLDSRDCFADEGLSATANRTTLLPESEDVFYGVRLQFKRRPSLWYEDKGRVREAPNVAGAFSDEHEKKPTFETLKVTGDATVYLAWHPQEYEGIAVS